MCKKAIWLLAILFVVSCWKYSPPENVQLLLEMDDYTLYCPVWSSAGKIYFIKNTTLGEDFGGGELWVGDTSGENARLLLDGRFGYVAVATDGAKLALTCGHLINEGSYDGGPLIIVDSAGRILDTISTSEPKVVSARFSYDGTKIYYYAIGGDSNGFYRANIDGTSEEFLQGENYPTIFDITEGGRIVSMCEVCDLSPADSNLLIGAYTGVWTMGEELYLRNLATQDDSIINVKPYKSTAASFPYWAPDGNKIIFTAAPKGSVEGWPGDFSLWILDLTKEE